MTYAEQMQLIDKLVAQVKNMGVVSDTTNINSEGFHVSPLDMSDIMRTIYKLRESLRA